MTNSIILQNIDPESLRALIGEVVAEKIAELKPKPQTKDHYLTRKEVAVMIRVSLPTLNELTKSGKLQACRIGGRVLYLESHIKESLNMVAGLRYARK